MSNGKGNNNNKQQGPPEHAGIPDEVRQRLKHTKRNQDGTIEVGDSSLQELSAQIDWQTLTPFQEFLLAALEELDLLDELAEEVYDSDGENPFEA